MPLWSRRGEDESSFVRRVLVATDRSETAAVATAWAAEMAGRYEAELVVVRVFVPPAAPDAVAQADLQQHARELAGDRGRAVITTGDDPAKAIADAADAADVYEIALDTVR